MTNTATQRSTYINLPVTNVAASIAFFSALGLKFNSRMSSATTAHLSISDTTSLLLHDESYFQQFTGSVIADTTTTREVAVGLSAASRAEVDELITQAVAAGGHDIGAQDDGPMYMRAFRDLDGHQWSVIFVDMAAMGGSR